MIRLALIVAWLATATTAFAYTDADYCLETRVAERVDCRAEYWFQVARCLDQRATDRWIGYADADADHAACVEDARLDRVWCYGQMTQCEGSPS